MRPPGPCPNCSLMKRAVSARDIRYTLFANLWLNQEIGTVVYIYRIEVSNYRNKTFRLFLHMLCSSWFATFKLLMILMFWHFLQCFLKKNMFVIFLNLRWSKIHFTKFRCKSTSFQITNYTIFFIDRTSLGPMSEGGLLWWPGRILRGGLGPQQTGQTRYNIKKKMFLE